MKKHLLTVLLFALAGCTTVAHLPTNDRSGSGAAGAAAAGDVQLFAGRDIGQRFKVVGVVVAGADGESGKEAIAKLKEEAAKLGANAVVDVRLEIEMGFWSPGVKASGVAVLR